MFPGDKNYRPSFHAIEGYKVSSDTKSTTVTQMVNINGRNTKITLEYKSGSTPPQNQLEEQLRATIIKMAAVIDTLRLYEGPFTAIRISRDDKVTFSAKELGKFKGAKFIPKKGQTEEMPAIKNINNLYEQIRKNNLDLKKA